MLTGFFVPDCFRGWSEVAVKEQCFFMSIYQFYPYNYSQPLNKKLSDKSTTIKYVVFDK